MGISLIGISEKIGADKDIRLDIRENLRRHSLINFQNGIFLLHMTAQGGILNQRGGNTGINIAAKTIIYNIIAVVLHHICNQIGYGCLAVGAGNANDKLRFINLIQKIRTDINPAKSTGDSLQTEHQRSAKIPLL